MNKKFFMLKFVKYMVVALVGMASYCVNAACYTNQGGATPQSQTIYPGVIKVQRDLPIGSLIASFPTQQTGIALSCTAGGSSDGYYYEMSLFKTQTSIPNVYQTNVPGVGVRLSAWGGSYNYPATFMNQPNAMALWFYAGVIDFIKTGAITSDVLNTGLLARVYGNGDRVTAVSYNIGSTSISQLACSIQTSNLTYPIGDVLSSKFGASVGTIPSGAQSTQNLGLNCDAGANINVMLQGNQNPDVSTTSVLALTGQGNADVAKGVGVQLLYNGTPLDLNNRIVLKQSAGGQETFPLTARYYQTKTSVSTGKANASATLDLTYQ